MVTMTNKRPTMDTVAKEAGVSVMTVSRALRNLAVVPEATRQRIHEVARQVGYRPNPMISTLMAQLYGSRTNAQSPVICYVTAYPDPEHWRDLPYNVDAYRGAHRRAEELGYRLEHFCLTEPGMTPERAVKILKTRGVVGLLFAPLPVPEPVPPVLPWENFACATIGRSWPNPALHSAMVNHYSVMRMTYRSLLELGYRRIGLALRPMDDNTVENKWLAGFWAEQFFQATEDRVPVLWEENWTRETFMEWFREATPEVIITMQAGDVIEWLKKAGVRIPEDVGVAVPDRSYRTQYPNLSGVDQRTELVGEIALNLVVEQIHHNERGIPAVAKLVTVPGIWVQGEYVRRITPSPPAQGGRKSRKSPKVRSGKSQ